MLLLFNVAYAQQVDLINENFDDGLPSSWTHYSTNWGSFPQWVEDSGAMKEASGPYFGPVTNWVQLPGVDFTSVNAPFLELDLAIAESDTNIQFSVLYTTDSVWHVLSTYGSATSGASNVILVATSNDNNWIPESTDYQTITVDLSPFQDESNIRFSFGSDYMNYFASGVWYIDNVRIFGESGTSVFEHTENPAFQLYPNPSYGLVNFSSNKEVKDATLKITDVTGILVLEKTIDSNTEEIDLSSYPSGIYFVQYNYPKKSFIKKLIIN